MKIEYNSININSSMKNELSSAKRCLQNAIDHFLSDAYPSGFILSYVNNPLGECYDHQSTIDSILEWLNDSERQITDVINNIESNLTDIGGYDVKRINSTVK